MARYLAAVCALFVLASLLAAAPRSADALACGSVSSALSPCIGYIRGKGPLTAGCCNGVRSLNAMASTTPARRDACNCLKTYNAKIPGVIYKNVAAIPGACHVNVGYPITPSVDCSKVK